MAKESHENFQEWKLPVKIEEMPRNDMIKIKTKAWKHLYGIIRNNLIAFLKKLILFLKKAVLENLCICHSKLFPSSNY